MTLIVLVQRTCQGDKSVLSRVEWIKDFQVDSQSIGNDFWKTAYIDKISSLCLFC